MDYVVKKGETLSGIAKTLGIANWRDLYEANKSVVGTNPNLIKVGQTLSWGGGAPTPSPTPTTGGGFTEAQLNTTYQKLLNRTVDPTGLRDFGSAKWAGKSIADLEAAIINSDEYRAKTASPSTTDEVAKRLADVTAMSFDKFTAAEAPKVRTAEEIKTDITSQLPTTEKPIAPKLEESYMKMREDLGVDDLEAMSTDLKSQKEELLSQYRTLVYDERGKPILSRLIQGRNAKAAREVQDQLDFITRQEAVNTDKLNTKYNIINMKMGFAQTDYQTAKTEYDSDYSNALSMINAVSTVQTNENAELKAFKTDARANLTLYSNLFASGQMTWDGLTADQRTQMNKLEVQAGLGVGYLRSVQPLLGTGGTIKSVTTRQAADGYEYADALVINADGSIKVVTTKLGTFYKAPRAAGSEKTPSESELQRQALSSMDSQLGGVTGSDGKVSPENFNTARTAWVRKGFKREDFDTAFKDYANLTYKTAYDDYGLEEAL